MKTLYRILSALLLLLVSLACQVVGTSTPQPQAAPMDPAVFNTMVALTAAAQQAQATAAGQSIDPSPGLVPVSPTPVYTQALPATVPPPTNVPPTDMPPTNVPPTNPPADVYAPDPLGPAWSGMAFSKDTCYDLDVLFTAADSTVDVCLDANVVLTPKNGALMSGSATRTPPSLNTCKSASLNADVLAPNTGLYMCFKTNAGKYGFFVMRDDQMFSNGYIVFDAYLFP